MRENQKREGCSLLGPASDPRAIELFTLSRMLVNPRRCERSGPLERTPARRHDKQLDCIGQPTLHNCQTLVLALEPAATALNSLTGSGISRVCCVSPVEQGNV
jgi:hypothetical protein